MKLRSTLGIGAGILTASTALAHHSPSAFDMQSEVVIEGTVAKLDWGNPHVYFTVEIASADGRSALQAVEVGPLAAVQAYGLKREAVAPGSHVVVRANPNRGGPGKVVRGLDVTTSDGAIYALTDRGRNSTRAPVVPATGIAGVWVPPPSAFSAVVRGAPSWPLNDAGRTARAKAQQTSQALGFCEPWPAPVLTTLPEPRAIEVGDDAIVMRFDAEGVEIIRTIHLDQSEHPAGLEPSVQGHSIGRWDGKTLVIDTAGFAPHPAGISMGLASGPAKHLVERLTLTDDRLHLQYEMTLEEPTYLTQPLSYTMLWDHRPDIERSSVACDPEVARRFLSAD